MEISNNKEKEFIINFTKDQLNAYQSILDFINAPYNPSDCKRALIGAAGTGKTYLVKALIKNCNLSYSQIGLSAPTHKANRVLAESIGISNVKVNTLASDLGLKLNFDADKFDIKNPPFDPKGRVKLGDYRIYIVDEASMINRDLCTFLEKTCKEKRCKLIYIGDASQLAPVGEVYSPAFRAIKFNALNQIVRQEEDNPIRDLLSLLRDDIKNKTFKFIYHITNNREKFDNYNIKGFKVCNTQEFANQVNLYFNDEQLTKNVDFSKIVAYTNICVSKWNKYIRNNIILDANKSIITKNDLIISYTTIVNQFNEVVIANSEEYIINDIVNYIHPTYDIKGFLVKFQAIHGGKITTPIFVLDHKDQLSINRYVQISNSLVNNAKNANRILKASKWKEYYSFKESCLLLIDIVNPNNGQTLFKRDLDYGFALTAHKSQGSTFDTVFVDVDDIVFDKTGKVYTNVEEINRRLYVACSRCKNKLYLKYNGK